MPERPPPNPPTDPPTARLALLRVASLPFAALAPLAGEAAAGAADALLALEEALAAEAAALGERIHAAVGPAAAPGAEGARSAAVAVRRALHNRRAVAPHLLATAGPCLGRELAAAIAAHLIHREASLAARTRFTAAYRDDLRRSRGALVALASTPFFQLGLRLVSRSLLARSVELAGRDLARCRHDERHTAAKLAAYAARFTTKTSPNSVFCATALARITGVEAAVAGDNRPARLDVLLNVSEARKVTAVVGASPDVWPAVIPRINPTLRPTAAGWTFWRPSSPRHLDDEEVLSRVKAQPALSVFLEEAARGLTVPRLLAAVAARTGLPESDLADYLARLAEAGVLIAEIEPPFAERRPLAFVAAAVRAAGLAPPWLPVVEAIERDVESLAGLAPAERPVLTADGPAATADGIPVTADGIPAMDDVEERLRTLPRTQPARGDELFRIDVASGLEVILPADVLAALAAPLRRYAHLFAALYPERTLLDGWLRPFLAHHPADTDVPLLDLYHGLFEPAQHRRPAGFPAPPTAREALPGTDPAAVWVRTRDFFAARARAALAAGQEEVVFAEDDWDELLGDAPEPTWSAGALFQIAAADAAAIAAGRYRLVLNGLFPAGVALARFAHLHGVEAVTREVARGWSPLERGGALLAEVTYTHMGRGANAGLCPRIYRHEIELPGERASPGAEVIPLADLVARWDSGAGRFVLRSLSRGSEVVPVVSSGISPEGFVSFLVEVGRQGLQPLAWFPGFDLPDVPCWPRFRSGKLVLFRRRWTFAPGAGAVPMPPREAGDPDAAAAEHFLAARRWRRKNGLPRHVFVHTAADPKPFYLDLESPLGVDLLRRALVPAEGAEAPALHVTEMLPRPRDLWLADGAGRYAAELLVQLRRP